MEERFPTWHIVGMLESDDKNGGPNNLKAWREYREITQEALAKDVGTSANMIQYLESGERGLSLKWLRRLAPALQTSPGMLADHSPEDIDMEMHDLFVRRDLSPDQRRQLAAIADVMTKSGTTGS